MLEADHNQHHMQMFLDTGANASVLYRSALDAIGRQENLKLRTKQEKVAGVGGVIHRKTEFVPTLEIEVFGKPIILKNLSLLPQMSTGSGRYRDGVIGMDALGSGFRLDFETMRMEIQ